MRFRYKYRTSDNTLHEGEVSASDRDSAFAKLKSIGIRPSRIDEAPGLFNKLFGKGKRWLAIAVLSTALVALLFTYFAAVSARRVEASGGTRRQILGDHAIITEGIETGWAKVLPDVGDRWLAMYAIPGAKTRSDMSSASPLELHVVLRDLEKNMTVLPAAQDGDIAEYRQLKEIVAGIKRELAAAVANGETVEGFLRTLDRRQGEERAFYLQCERDIVRAIENDAFGAGLRTLWEAKNEELRKRGIAALPCPEEAR